MLVSYPAKRLYLLIERYKREFPRGTYLGNAIPTLTVCASQHGRMDDVELFMNLRPFHKYVTNSDVNGYQDDIERICESMIAARPEHFQLVQYLIEQGGADPNIALSGGWNGLHVAAYRKRINTELIELLLPRISLYSINQETDDGDTALGRCYERNPCPMKQEINALLCSKGGGANNIYI
eukprot:g3563.t1